LGALAGGLIGAIISGVVLKEYVDSEPSAPVDDAEPDEARLTVTPMLTWDAEGHIGVSVGCGWAPGDLR